MKPLNMHVAEHANEPAVAGLQPAQLMHAHQNSDVSSSSAYGALTPGRGESNQKFSADFIPGAELFNYGFSA